MIRNIFCLSILLLFINISWSQSLPDNYYVNSKDSGRSRADLMTASKFGFYSSFGVGSESGYEGLFTNHSIAFKSHLLTFSWGYLLSGEMHDGKNYYSSDFAGIMLGEAFRSRNLFLSISGGISDAGYSHQYREVTNSNTGYYSSWKYDSYHGSVPVVEAKIYIHLYYVFGVGYMHTACFTPDRTLHFNNFSLLFGYWNDPKARKRRAHIPEKVVVRKDSQMDDKIQKFLGFKTIEDSLQHDYARNTIFIEKDCRGLTINYDRLFLKKKKDGFSLRIGAGYNTFNVYRWYRFPLQLNYITGNKRNNFEFGGGVEVRFLRNKIYDNAISLNLFYRYQSIGKGLFFKAGFAPIIERYPDVYSNGFFGYILNQFAIGLGYSL